MRRKKTHPQPPLTREQELHQEFQQAEAAELKAEPEAVDKRFRNEKRMWRDVGVDPEEIGDLG